MFITINAINNENFDTTDSVAENSTMLNHPLSDLRFWEHKLHKASKLKEILRDYYDSLEQYKRFLSNYFFTNYNSFQKALFFFDNPLISFVMVDKTLKLICCPQISFIDIPAAFQFLEFPLSENCFYEKRLINSLKRYLNANTPVYFRTLYKYRFYELKDKNILAYNSRRTPFDNPDEAFFTICGNLYVSSYNGAAICLSSSNIKRFFTKIWEIPYPKDTGLLKRLLRQCKKHISHNYTQTALSGASVVLVQDEINRQCFEFRYSETDKSFIVSELQNENLIHLKECNSIHCHAISNPEITPEISELVYHITSGDFKTLKCWSILFANIASCEYMTKKLFIIQCDSKESNLIHVFFDLAFYNMNTHASCEMPYHSLKKLITPAVVPDLCSCQISGGKYFFIDKIDHLYIDEEVKQFKKIISGKPIEYKDEIFGKITYTNNLPIVCVVSSHKDYVYLKNNYPYIELSFRSSRISSDTVSDNIPDTENIKQETFSNNNVQDPKTTHADPYDWLRLKFSLYGLLHINKLTNESEKTHTPPAIKHDCILNEFINLCCKEKTESFTTANDLYNAYFYFYTHLYPSTALTKKGFIKTLKLCEKFEYKRPHVSRSGGNPYAFMGIELKNNYKDLVAEKTDKAFSSPNARLFFEQLSEIDHKILFNYENLSPMITTSDKPRVWVERIEKGVNY